ncbi:MAG: hypothetical protein ACP5E5_06140 [Acidobacteriaceae bacterium]
MARGHAGRVPRIQRSGDTGADFFFAGQRATLSGLQKCSVFAVIACIRRYNGQFTVLFKFNFQPGRSLFHH